MKKESPFIEVPKEWKTIIGIAQRAIEARQILTFYYESKNGNKGYRTIGPYMIIPRNGNLEVVGSPTTELSKPKEKRQPGHYTISQLKRRIESKQFEVLPDTFDDPGVSREIVVNTQTPPVCRFIYDDENVEKIKMELLRVKYV